MMTLIRGRDWPVYLVMVLIACVLVYQGRHYIMQIHYNPFLLGLGAMSAALVLVSWYVGKAPDAEDGPESDAGPLTGE